MIFYGYTTATVNKKDIEDISNKEAKHILDENKMTINSLPRYGHMGMKKKDIKQHVNEKTYINI